MSHKNRNTQYNLPERSLYITPIEVIDSCLELFCGQHLNDSSDFALFEKLDFGVYDIGCNDGRWLDRAKIIFEKNYPRYRFEYFGIDIFQNENFKHNYINLDISQKNISLDNRNNVKIIIGNPPFFGQEIGKTLNMLESSFNNNHFFCLYLPHDYSTGIKRSELFLSYVKPTLYNLVPRINYDNMGKANDSNNSLFVKGNTKILGYYYIYNWKTRELV